MSFQLGYPRDYQPGLFEKVMDINSRSGYQFSSGEIVLHKFTKEQLLLLPDDNGAFGTFVCRTKTLRVITVDIDEIEHMNLSNDALKTTN